MVRSAVGKLNSTRGVNRLIVILLIAVLVLTALALVPAVRAWLWHGELDGCDIARRRTRDLLSVETLVNGEQLDTETARALAAEKGSLCPTGGDFYIVEDPDSKIGMDVVCGLHDSDTKRRTRLNALEAYEQTDAALAACLKKGEAIPDQVEVTLNSKTFAVQRVETAPDIRRGTAATSGYEGTVLFYQANDAGKITFFCYADENHCARWRAETLWTGDCFE